MKTSMAKTSQDKKHFHWSTKVSNEDQQQEEEKQEEVKEKAPSFNPSCPHNHNKDHKDLNSSPSPLTRKKFQTLTISRFRSVLTSLSKKQPNLLHGLGPKVVGTLFGSRRGHVHFAFQKNPTSQPAFLIELQTPISGLVKEMASGLVRIALECDKDDHDEKIKKVGSSSSSRRLLEESVWRTFCNGKKCGFASRRECGEKEWRVLKAVEPISMGAGVLPSGVDEEDDQEGEMMYMRAKFERVVGSRDSEAFYMMNPDSNGTPELSIYLLRV